jgi:hypothetical protein
MTKSGLVKIGVPALQAEGMRGLRKVRQILEQHDAAIARLVAATNDRIRATVAEGDGEIPEEMPDPAHADAQPVA